MPTLTLTYQGGSANSLALTQLNPSTYEGYIVVPDDAGQLVGSFQFSGNNSKGIQGNQITAGNLFIVDTTQPAKVETFKAVNGSGSVNLTWYYPDDNVVFNIYRSTEPGVDYTDLLTTTTGDNYQDYDVKGAVTYYYRIAAVNQAGNIGELSDEQYASPAAVAYQEQAVGALLDPVLQVGLDTRLNNLNTKIMNAEQSLHDFQTESDAEKSRLINDLGLLNKAQDRGTSPRRSKSKLEALRTLSLTRDDFNTRVTAIQSDIDAALASPPVNVSVTE